MSLQWMAALVTNAWWDDLWLGQAFADYMAHRVPSEVTRFTGAPTTFAARRKGQAYVADQRPSTHPISLDGPDVQTVLLEMDRISYFKGIRPCCGSSPPGSAPRRCAPACAPTSRGTPSAPPPTPTSSPR